MQVTNACEICFKKYRVLVWSNSVEKTPFHFLYFSVWQFYFTQRCKVRFGAKHVIPFIIIDFLHHHTVGGGFVWLSGRPIWKKYIIAVAVFNECKGGNYISFWLPLPYGVRILLSFSSCKAFSYKLFNCKAKF